ncbi:replicative DNA helicase [Nocardia asteroides]|uniref:Replicative DNA helicase n=1 Tax=Nocardia asteroides NBRC 15531 TaxID=1110697 RepID=U5E3U3_NOCAS|nr:replicative DNA helicase [Nocardia asteroides]UGT48649.1 replicative DNA helicase [Nocardia asteroides]GAD83132.1 putative replicative DNA helicase [Nocardia asteroides NBRC 15531]SFL66697.1 replicative DNA helicase [Nocardia asteroides]VEG31785.1 Replicative DNA helicase [Nocardia asteroides]
MTTTGDRAQTDFPPEPPGEDFGRQPPHDMAAEQSVLGGMLLSKDAIADVVEVLRPGDFYRPAHQAVYDTILDLYGRGEPADPVTVAAGLDRRGELKRIGGPPYLVTLTQTVPTAANAGFYAEIVAEKAILRRLVEAGTRIVQFGYAGADGQDIAEVVDRAQAEVYEVTERRTTEDFMPLEELLQPTMDEIDSIASRGGISLGVPTGFTELDELTNGLHPGQMIIVAARPGVGKALALDTPLPTPNGWTTMGEVRVGDELVGPDGRPTRVVATTEVMSDRPCYEVEFSDGTVIIADEEHQWTTLAPTLAPHPVVRTTGDIAHSLRTPRDHFAHAVPRTARSEARQIVDVRKIDPLPVRCVQVDNTDHMYLAGRSLVPTHNSTLGMDFMRSCSIKHGLASVIFSLEMSRTEIVMRLLSAEAKIKLGDMRSGRMSDDDWTKLARRMSEISEAPLFVDDSPNLTMMEIRAKARRLKQRHDLKLVVVDYLQLMTSGKKVESRQQEVSDFSRNLKLLAKELEVPVIAISQLNRGPEQRTDKRPMVSDLRESGCMPASTRILRADTGAEVSLGELLASGEQPLVWSLDERMRMVARPMVKVFPSGRKEVFRLRLASGREVEATGNHPFLTVDGWIALDKLTVGDRLATPRNVPEPVHTTRLPEDEIVLLAHMIGDGSCVKRQPIRYASVDEENLTAVTAAAQHFGVSAVRDEYAAARVTTLRLPAPYQLTHGKRNPIAAWLDSLGLFGLRSYEKFVPEPIFALPNDQVALFLRHLWATDGSVRWDAKARQARVYYASTSRRLIDDVNQLLLRLGVHGRIKTVRKGDYRPCYHLVIDGGENQSTFLRDVGVHGARGKSAEAVLTELAPMTRNPNVDTVPAEVWNRVRTLLADKEMTHREFSAAMGSRFCGSTMWKRSPSRSRLARVAAVLDDADIDMLATNDVFWDKIVEITSLGEQDVYDGTVPGTHNFVAQGISAHNSLEQDADMVILLHRPDAFERDDPRGGEADLIVGKHRNGPTATITVAHQLHLSRFVDMARG